MRTFGQLLILFGLVMAVGSLALLIGIFIYVVQAQPADASGWGAALGESMIAAFGLVPIGIVMLIVGIVMVRSHPVSPR